MHYLACQTKEELLRVLGLQEEQGSSLEFLRRGYKVVPSIVAFSFCSLPSPLLTIVYEHLVPMAFHFYH